MTFPGAIPLDPIQRRLTSDPARAAYQERIARAVESDLPSPTQFMIPMHEQNRDLVRSQPMRQAGFDHAL